MTPADQSRKGDSFVVEGRNRIDDPIGEAAARLSDAADMPSRVRVGGREQVVVVGEFYGFTHQDLCRR
jgi:hypothetical protein